ncbi:endo alpha-1,4 polygalactosaminidase [Roseospira goensis]|uniref:Uncharacterized protein (TIGR01370 family) n=1 Tax=Roseospira goensis TaxID=391922 RepID=A0A7W6S071_9PROT|nr:endo alpha-1,4 polygalactosaminidase [Roseospira goensis]MBB4285985.1 uncharacterized protein (TIGR01370 family) [Roseospira goensis]
MSAAAAAPDGEGGRWVVYYGAEAPMSAFAPYDLVVLDSAVTEIVRPLRKRDKDVLGYLSLGEVDRYRPWADDLEAAGLLGPVNPNWPDSRLIDLRDPAWTRMVVERLVPRILRHGFSGVFLDTLDTAIHREETDPARHAGMIDAAAGLVRTLRRHYPAMRIAVNRAYTLLPRIVDQIDILLGEAVVASFDFESRTYRRVDDDAYRWQVERLVAARRANPALRVLTLDYWPSGEAEVIAKIYQAQRRNGFDPYVATIALDTIVPEPGRSP